MLALTTIGKGVLETLGGAWNQAGLTLNIQQSPALRFRKLWSR
jgi:hypothetical protein